MRRTATPTRAAAKRCRAQAAAVERIAAPMLLVTGDEDGVAPPAGRARDGRPLHGARNNARRSCCRAAATGRRSSGPRNASASCASSCREREDLKMRDVMFTNVRVFDGGGEAAVHGDVLVQGNRILARREDGLRRAVCAGGRCAGDRRRRRISDARMVEAQPHFS